jgi:hypothetical protein
VALAAWLRTGLGGPVGKVVRLFAQFGPAVPPGGLTQAIARAATSTCRALAIVLRTAAEQRRNPIELLAGLLRAPDPSMADLRIPRPPP